MLEEKTRKRFFLFDLINSFFFFLFLHGLPIRFSDIISQRSTLFLAGTSMTNGNLAP